MNLEQLNNKTAHSCEQFYYLIVLNS